ncbi:MAG: heme exporter protein CcmB [Gemmatimonadota bacterium]|jgi:heme exporter protein B|nr:heme exporter protein CcmB [Gemmatimonadota bacterium]
MQLALRTWAILWKDMLIELRTKQSFSAMIFFAALVLFLFGFAVGPDTATLSRLGGGLLWIAIAFTGMLSLGRTFQSEEVAGGLDGLRMYPGEVRAIYLGKLLANFTFLLVLEAFLVPVAVVLLHLEPWEHLPVFVGIMLLGTFGFSVIGTFYASLTHHLRARELMLPLLLFPALVPVFLGAVNATSLALAGDPLGQIGVWIRLLISFDVIFLVLCVWIFPTVLEE